MLHFLFGNLHSSLPGSEVLSLVQARLTYGPAFFKLRPPLKDFLFKES